MNQLNPNNPHVLTEEEYLALYAVVDRKEGCEVCRDFVYVIPKNDEPFYQECEDCGVGICSECYEYHFQNPKACGGYNPPQDEYEE